MTENVDNDYLIYLQKEIKVSIFISGNTDINIPNALNKFWNNI